MRGTPPATISEPLRAAVGTLARQAVEGQSQLPQQAANRGFAHLHSKALENELPNHPAVQRAKVNLSCKGFFSVTVL